VQVHDVNRVNNGFLLVPCDDFELACLNYLLDREREDIGIDNLFPGMVYQYILRSWFIDGHNLSLDSIPDRVINRIKRDLENGTV
jgi:hypothetical protein